MPARKETAPPVGTLIGVQEVIGLPVAKKVSGRSGQSSSRNRYFVPVRCTGCKQEREVREDALKAMATAACGYCYLSPDPDPEARIKVERIWNGRRQSYDRYRYHGRSYEKLHSVWTNMRERCNNPTSEKWERYGGRGITVDPAWDNFRAFAEWAENSGYAEGLTIDRIDNDRGYSPDNCRWIADLENLLNRGRYLSTPLAKALDRRAALDGTDTYSVIHQAVESYRRHLLSGGRDA